MQEIGCACAKFRRGLARELARSFKHPVRKPSMFEKTFLQISIQVVQRNVSIPSRSLFSKDPQTQSVDDFQLAQIGDDEGSSRTMRDELCFRGVGVRDI